LWKEDGVESLRSFVKEAYLRLITLPETSLAYADTLREIELLNSRLDDALQRFVMRFSTVLLHV
jgi:hypothetical protein